MQVDRKALIRALKTVTPIMERRNPIPILGAVRMQTGRDLSIEATDLDLEMRVTLPYQGSADVNYCQLSPASLIPLLKATDAETVDLSRDHDKKHRLSAGQMAVSLGHGLPSDDFPTMVGGTEAWGAAIGAEFMNAVKRVSLAMSTEETRYYLNSIYFHHVDGWTYRLVATDGHRLIYANVELPDAPDGAALAHAGGASGSKGVILPRKMVGTLLRLHAERRAAPIRFGLIATAPANNQPGAADLTNAPKVRARFEVEEVSMQGKLIDGTFPDYVRVIPAEGKHTSEIGAADLRRAVGALVGFIPERARAMKLRFEKSRLTLSANSVELGADAELSMPATTAGGDFEVGFNGRYLLTALAAAGGETIHFSTNDSASPTLFYDPTSTAVRTVLMPMRVS